ncbi:MGMT family protein [Gallaecimonas pentaromativorans]|uniref:O(6)-alkylguanine repair protein YbaZ n=1 Tax=Gallaecimonas pentaromativorans TaxID=584787 RepID=A0A3N1PA73_9GAMM|nr:MGMT family protein [Gallaecimonas pentaromativorans]MED5525829.1 MGMT family protein [Pseudomonadota bacterium]ROQ24939.1 O(6)-alkylguanine repair protein YbaZ [Gallaecimonas pentaromativorans]
MATSTDPARLYTLVALIPAGQVATYGQLASILGWNPRLVGRYMASCPAGLPWHRVVNAQGGCSVRDSQGHLEQHQLLLAEGVVIKRSGRVDLRQALWSGL